jgi:hypothetical protein
MMLRVNGCSGKNISSSQKGCGKNVATLNNVWIGSAELATTDANKISEEEEEEEEESDVE